MSFSSLLSNQEWREPFALKNQRVKYVVAFLTIFVYLTYAIRGFLGVWAYGFFNYTVNWSYGFIPRGLWGTILKFIFGDLVQSVRFLTVLQCGIAFCFLAYICYTIYRLICVDGNISALIILLIFSTSGFNMFYLRETGFLDHVIFLLVAFYIEICLRGSAKACLIWGGIFSALSIWLLETSAFLMCPIFASIAAIRLISEEEMTWKRASTYLVFTFAPTLLSIFAYRLMIVDPESLAYYLKEAKQLTQVDQSAFQELAGLFTETNLHNISPSTWVYIPPQVVLYACLMVGVTSLFLLGTHVNKRILLAYFVFALASGFTGYAAIYFGTDYQRYYFSTVFSIFLISLYVFRLNAKKHIQRWQGIILTIGAVLIVLPILGYRLWAWNGFYKDFWFEPFLEKLIS